MHILYVAPAALMLGLVGCGGSGGSTPVDPPVGQAQYLYVTSTGAPTADGQPTRGAVYQYAIATDGSLTTLSPASVATGLEPTAMSADPTGHDLYVANKVDATISRYTVGSGGQLTALSPTSISNGTAGGLQNYAMSVDPSGRFLYVVAWIGRPVGGPSYPPAFIAQYSIGSDGSLAPLAPAYVSVPLSSAGPLAIDPAGHYAYLPGVTASPPPGEFLPGVDTWPVPQFSIGADGTLSQVDTFYPGHPLADLTITPDGKLAYGFVDCAGQDCDGIVTSYSIGTNGALTQTTMQTMVTGTHANPIAIALDPSASSAYVLVYIMGIDTGSGALNQYGIGNDGSLSPYNPASFAVTTIPVAEAVAGSNLYLLTANGLGIPTSAATGGQIAQYAIGTGGLLNATGSTSVGGSSPTAMALVATH